MLNSIRNQEPMNRLLTKRQVHKNALFVFYFVTMLTNTPYAAGGQSCGTTNAMLGPKKRHWDKQRSSRFVFFRTFPAFQHVVFVPRNWQAVKGLKETTTTTTTSIFLTYRNMRGSEQPGRGETLIEAGQHLRLCSFSNRTSTSVDDGKKHGSDNARLPVPNLPLCYWSSHLFDLCAPSSS